jgi:hypothetical protein
LELRTIPRILHQHRLLVPGVSAMGFGLIYWILMLIWFVFSLAVFGGYGGMYGHSASALLEFILFLLLGWKVFGPPVHP